MLPTSVIEVGAGPFDRRSVWTVARSVDAETRLLTPEQADLALPCRVGEEWRGIGGGARRGIPYPVPRSHAREGEEPSSRHHDDTNPKEGDPPRGHSLLGS